MTTFHPFPRLALELRQRIWELSMAPRKVLIRFRTHCPSTPAPALMHTCLEARSYLQRYYTKSFRIKSRPEEYAWVNFDIDVIYMEQDDMEKFPTEQPLIQQLILEGTDAEIFYRYHIGKLIDMGAQALKTVTILDRAGGAGPDRWWQNWDDLMEMMYYKDDPVPFYTKILGPPGAKITEINPDNYLKVERDDRRARVAANPENFDLGYAVSDSDDDVDAPNRFRTGWHHVDGCNCPSRQSS